VILRKELNPIPFGTMPGDRIVYPTGSAGYTIRPPRKNAGDGRRIRFGAASDS